MMGVGQATPVESFRIPSSTTRENDEEAEGGEGGEKATSRLTLSEARRRFAAGVMQEEGPGEPGGEYGRLGGQEFGQAPSGALDWAGESPYVPGEQGRTWPL
jgi:hypothetical protein